MDGRCIVNRRLDRTHKCIRRFIGFESKSHRGDLVMNIFLQLEIDASVTIKVIVLLLVDCLVQQKLKKKTSRDSDNDLMASDASGISTEGSVFHFLRSAEGLAAENVQNSVQLLIRAKVKGIVFQQVALQRSCATWPLLHPRHPLAGAALHN